MVAMCRAGSIESAHCRRASGSTCCRSSPRTRRCGRPCSPAHGATCGRDPPLSISPGGGPAPISPGSCSNCCASAAATRATPPHFRRLFRAVSICSGTGIWVKTLTSLRNWWMAGSIALFAARSKNSGSASWQLIEKENYWSWYHRIGLLLHNTSSNQASALWCAFLSQP